MSINDSVQPNGLEVEVPDEGMLDTSAGAADGEAVAGAGGTDADPTAQAQTPTPEELQAQLAATQRDMDRLRSSYDRQAAQRKLEYEQRLEEAKRQVDQAKMQTMTEEEQKDYEFKLALQENERLRNEKRQMQERENQRGAWQVAVDYFKDRPGFDASKLITDGSYEDLLTSGWAEIDRLLKDKTSSKTSSAQHSGKSPLKDVKGGAAQVTMSSMVKERFGGDTEAFYKEIEQDPDFAAEVSKLLPS